MPSLTYASGPRAGRRISLTSAGLTIGRAADCEIVIDDVMASSHHVRITRVLGHWHIEDLNSSNGTLLNGREIHQATLQPNDLLEIGATQLKFTDDVPEPVPVPPVAPAAAAPLVAARPAAGPSAMPDPMSGFTPQPAEPRPVAVPIVAPSPAPASPRPMVVEHGAPVVAGYRPAPSASASAEDLRLVEQMRVHTDRIRQEVAKVIVGQQQVLDEILMSMIAGGHALLVGMPGMAKTLMVSTIAKVLDLQFKRIQFTPDLMPTDITGTEVLESNRETMEKNFRFIRGPIFCNLLLADEINRTPPKTQAALLEAMQEKRVTVGNVTYGLDAPFFVLATQNPIEQEGTYPLPEAQMDRFMFNIWVDYPLEHEEEQIVKNTTVAQGAQPEKVLSQAQMLQLQEVVRKVPVSDHVIKYAIRLVRATRPGNADAPDFTKKYIHVGAGPRAGQYLVLAAKARAILEGRIHVSCKDIQRAAIPVLRHRMYTNFAADSEGLTAVQLVDKLIKAVPEPSEKDYA